VKFQPEIGDTTVVGTVDFITRSSVNVGVFDANVTTNGYASAAQNVFDARLRFQCSVPDGLSNGDWVTADIVASESGVAYATNIQAL
jgi:hypothetical protein